MESMDGPYTCCVPARDDSVCAQAVLGEVAVGWQSVLSTSTHGNQVCLPDAPAQVLNANKSAPEQLASLYKQYLPLLGNLAEATVQKFTEQAQAVSLSEVRDQLERCRAAADSIK